jgi:hypothetical protein
MILDLHTLLSDSQAFSATAVSTNAMDMGANTPKNDIGSGEPLAAVFNVEVAADTANADETYQFQVIQSANANLSSQDVLVQTDTTYITRATLVAGYQLVLPIPPDLVTKQYVGIRLVLGGTTPSVTLSASILPLKHAKVGRIYAKGYTIS